MRTLLLNASSALQAALLLLQADLVLSRHRARFSERLLTLPLAKWFQGSSFQTLRVLLLRRRGLEGMHGKTSRRGPGQIEFRALPTPFSSVARHRKKASSCYYVLSRKWRRKVQAFRACLRGILANPTIAAVGLFYLL